MSLTTRSLALVCLWAAGLPAWARKPTAQECLRATEAPPGARVWASGWGCSLELSAHEKRLDAFLRGVARKPREIETWGLVSPREFQELVRGRDWLAREMGSRNLRKLPYVGDVLFKAFKSEGIKDFEPARLFLIRSSLCSSDFEAEGMAALLAVIFGSDPARFLRELSRISVELDTGSGDPCDAGREAAAAKSYAPAIFQMLQMDWGAGGMPPEARPPLKSAWPELEKLPGLEKIRADLARVVLVEP